ncbi:MAG: alpha/beta hydrolase, partial [Thermodesulfovibrionia bacterium]|nr:alpha/beta hydrolase [Thermodesulfovibrionia bacterium]
MILKKMSIFIHSLLFVFLLLPACAEAESSAIDFSRSAWRQSVVTDPVFQGETFIIEGGNKSGKSMVLIHGVGDEASRIWEPFLQEYGAEYHLITFDLPGFGRSAKPNLLYSPAKYSDFVKWVVKEYAQGPIVLLGHSMGGALALHFAASYPEHVERLIIVDAAGVLHRTAFTKNLLTMDSQKKLPKILAATLKKPIAILNHLTGTTVEKIERENSGQAIDSILNNQSLRKIIFLGGSQTIASMAVAQEDFSPLLGRIRAPTYIIWGAEDEVAPVRTGKALAARLPGAKLEIIEEAGHNSISDQKLLFHKAMRRALVFEPVRESIRGIVLTSGRNGSCNNRSGMTFSGSYKSIDIRRCTDVLLQGVTTGAVHVQRSNIVIENSRIHGKDIGLFADHSKIFATGL